MMSGPFLDVPAGQKVYLELNGHTLHSNVTANDKEAGIGVPATAGLEVTDSVGGGLLRVRGGDFHPGLGVAIFLGLEVLAALAAVALVVGIVMTFLDIADALAEFFRSEASGTGRPSARTSAPGVACLSWSRIHGNRDWQRQERVPEASGTQRGSVSH
ncbi:hypothetical protein [Microlunatus sp. Y2014]|uniref:hypothetical protein n=1 Tax=Microlunatus sp. Y2014 TaxID=3418488 RepID=UPI003DA71B7C